MSSLTASPRSDIAIPTRTPTKGPPETVDKLVTEASR
jgi:hypothetical protein